MWTHHRTTIGRGCKLAAILAAAVLLCCALAGCTPISATSTARKTAPAIVQYSDYDDLTRALGFDMVQIAGGGYEVGSYSIIDGRIGQIIYNKGDIELNLRMMDGTGDITGVNAARLSPKDIDGVEVELGSFSTIQVASFAIGDYTYAMSATNISAPAFEEIVTNIVGQMALN